VMVDTPLRSKAYFGLVLSREDSGAFATKFLGRAC
jgi:hypothetical protein